MSVEFTTDEVATAITSFLEVGETVQATEGVYPGFAGVGWAARCLRYHLETLKSTPTLEAIRNSRKTDLAYIRCLENDNSILTKRLHASGASADLGTLKAKRDEAIAACEAGRALDMHVSKVNGFLSAKLSAIKDDMEAIEVDK